MKLFLTSAGFFNATISNALDDDSSLIADGLNSEVVSEGVWHRFG